MAGAPIGVAPGRRPETAHHGLLRYFRFGREAAGGTCRWSRARRLTERPPHLGNLRAPVAQPDRASGLQTAGRSSNHSGRAVNSIITWTKATC